MAKESSTPFGGGGWRLRPGVGLEDDAVLKIPSSVLEDGAEKKFRPGGRRTEFAPAPSSVLEDGARGRSGLRPGIRESGSGPDSVLELRPPSWRTEFEDGADSVLGSGNRAPDRTPSSSSVLRPGGRS
eukprot:gene10372-biopygen3194